LTEPNQCALTIAATSQCVSKAASVPQTYASLSRLALVLVFTAGLAGCPHKTVATLPQISMAPIDLEVPPEPEDPPMIEAPPEEVLVVPPMPPPARRPAPRRPAPAKDVPPAPPVQVASAAEAIGALSGGESTPQTQQQTKDLIASIKKRVAALPGKKATQQKYEISQVNRFLKQAQQALDSGDAEGAKNLATKASLLMDDIEKK